jgi:hypothetical protein
VNPALVKRYFSDVEIIEKNQPSALVSVEHDGQLFAFGNESNGKGVNAVAGVFIRKAFALEDVTQMGMAVSAKYFDASSVPVYMTLHALRVFFIEARPAAARIEFGLCGIERIVAAPTNKGAGREKLIVLACIRPLRALKDYDLLFFR